MDLNGDGNKDLLAAGYAGFCYIFYGNNNGGLEEVEILKDKSGANIHSGMYYDFQKKEYIYTNGVKNRDKVNFAKAVDWDNDGDLDLLLSGKMGIKLRINEGDSKHAIFANSNISVFNDYNADAVVDWDGDGLWDIISGSDDGNVYVLKNSGNKKSPCFNTAECIMKSELFVNTEKGESCGLTLPTVCDYNNDGKLDIVVGIKITGEGKPLDLSSEQIKKREEYKKRTEEIRKEALKITEGYKAKYNDILEYMNALRKNEKYKKLGRKLNDDWIEHCHLFSGGNSYGYVYVSLRK